MRKMRKLVIMVCIAAMITTNIPNWDAGAYVSGTVWSETGDTLIGNATVWKDEIITLNGNLTVNETGNLTLDNVTLLMNCTTNGSYHIEVLSGGEMYILNNSNITSVNENAHYNFSVRNDSKFEMRDSELSECGYEDANMGLTIEASNSQIEDCTFLNNYCGIYFYGSSNNNITNCSVYNNSNLGINFVWSSNNTIANCTIYENYNHGIHLYYSSDNILINNTVNNNVWRGIEVFASSNISITNCTVHNNHRGIEFGGGASNNDITACTIYNNSGDGIFLDSSSENNITNCALYNNSRDGIYLHYSSNNTISDCGIYNNSYFGIELYFSSNNTVTNCEIYNSFQHGINLVFSSTDNLVTNSAIYNSSYHGIAISDSPNNIMTNCRIYNNSQYGICLHSSSNTNIINSTITNSSNNDFYLTQNSQLISLNTTFNKTKVYVGANSTLNVSWYLNVNVTWKNNISAEYANVTIFYNLTNEVFNGSTDKNGLIKDIVIQEYTQNQTDTTSFTPHNVTASQGDINVWDDNVTVNKTKSVKLVLDHNAPEINYTTISPEQEYATDENTTVDFKFNVSHPDNLNLTYYWYLYLNETEVENATGTLENTTTIQPINWSYYFNYTSHGNYTVKVMVSDGNATVSYQWVLTVNDKNGRPVIELYYPPNNIILGNNSCVIFNVTASDPDNDVLSYQWRLNGAGVSNENKYIFYAEYNASENAINTYIIEAMVTDVTDEKLSVNHTWTVTVVDWNASYNNLLLQIELLKNALENITKLIGNIPETLLNRAELLENITWLVENITALNMTVLKDKLNQLFTEIENLNVTLAQMNENLTRIQGELNNATDKIGTLTTMLEEANATRDDAIDTMNSAISDKEDAKNETKTMENKMNNAIEAKNKAEYKLGASVVCGVIGGIIAGFLVSFLLRRKLPKKVKT